MLGIMTGSTFPVCDSNHNSTELPKMILLCHWCFSTFSLMKVSEPVSACCTGKPEQK
jgi:hypothetical protein